jgi:hypothetical protein
MIIKKLKGGSLSSTFLIKEKNRKKIRKQVSLTKNREYGFVRWYSQLKKIQKYNKLFPEIVWSDSTRKFVAEHEAIVMKARTFDDLEFKPVTPIRL